MKNTEILMNNFQLYRTNLLLSGQMKWDLVVGNTNSELFVSDFHLTPISNNIPFAFKSEETLLNNAHQENVRAYYNANKGNFYNEGLDSEFRTYWPTIYSEETNRLPKIYSDIYDMGCKRMRSFKRYNKQFEFFCPVWIEQLTGDLSFVVTVSNIVNDNSQTKNTIASRTLTLNNIGIVYHDKFVKYFKDYISYLDLDLHKGSDDLLDINFDNYTANVTGLDVTNGLVVIKSNNDLVNNLTSRERPLLEADNMLINMFADNKLICKQLFNFNICFNLADILPNVITRQMIGESISVSVAVKMGNEILELRDFDTNYEFIQRQYTVGDNIDINKDALKLQLNVLDYLHDYECVDLLGKNKFCQSRCHWSLCDNNDYIFNVYNGFSGFHIENESDNYLYYENNHQQGTYPNTLLDKYSKTDNSTGWINFENLQYNDNDENTNIYNIFYRDYILGFKSKIHNGTLFYDNTYVNNIKYSSSIKDHTTSKTINPLYILGVKVPVELLNDAYIGKHGVRIGSQVVEGIEYFKYVVMQYTDRDRDTNEDLLIIATNELDNLTYYNFKNNIKQHLTSSADATSSGESNNINNVLLMLSAYMDKNISPKLININGSLKYYVANSPSKDSTELIYCKDNLSSEYVLRYDGKIKPTFVKELSQRYIKDAFTNSDSDKDKLSIYGKYSKTQLEPLYPSIGYCAIKKNDNCNSTTSIYSATQGSTNYPEYAWFNNSKNIVLKETIEFDITEDDLKDGENSIDILKAVENKIKEYYLNIIDYNPTSDNPDDTYDKVKLQFIYDIYAIEYDHFYETTNDNTIKYNCHITLTLK